MVTVRSSVKSGTFEKKLHQILTEGLKKSGIRSHIETQAIRMTKLYRVLIIASKFKNLRPSERQDLVWRIIGQHLQPDDQLQISMIYTLTPEEARGKIN